MVTKPARIGEKKQMWSKKTDRLRVLILTKKGYEELAKAVKAALEQLEIAYGCAPLKAGTGYGEAAGIIRKAPENGCGAIIVIGGDSAHEAQMLSRASVVPMSLILHTGGRSAKYWLHALSELIGVEVGSGIPVFLSGDPMDDLTAAGNAAVHAAKCLALHDPKLRKRIYSPIVEGAPSTI